MTSKAQQAKDAQGYIKGSNQCQNCQYFERELIEVDHPYYSHRKQIIEKNKRCELGGFAVQLTASCDKHEPYRGPKYRAPK